MTLGRVVASDAVRFSDDSDYGFVFYESFERAAAPKPIKLASVYSFGIIADFYDSRNASGDFRRRGGHSIFSRRIRGSIFSSRRFFCFSPSIFSARMKSIFRPNFDQARQSDAQQRRRRQRNRRRASDGFDFYFDELYLHVAVCRHDSGFRVAGRLADAARRNARVFDRFRAAVFRAGAAFRNAFRNFRARAAG